MSYREEQESLLRENDELKNKLAYYESDGLRKALREAVKGAVPWLVGFSVLLLVSGLGATGVLFWIRLLPSATVNMRTVEQNASHLLTEMYPGRTYRLSCSAEGTSAVCHYRLTNPETGIGSMICNSTAGQGCRITTSGQ